MKNSLINQIKTLLGMEVKLEQMKLMDGVTALEADMFEAGNEIFVVTEDEQKIPVPVGEYEMEDGRMLIVVEEGIISEVKEKEEEEEEVEVEEPIEEEAKKEQEMETAKSAPKKVVESTIKESFFSEIEALKKENETLKAELSKLNEVKEVELSKDEEVKPISFNPENENKVETFKFANKRQRTIMDSVLNKLNK
jgi:predicted RNase H-like nuclease (RuvC/YqgF family)